MSCPAHPWGLPTGLPCLGDGPDHAHQFEASSDDLGDHGRHADETDQ